MKIIYKLLPFILIFVFVFSLDISAAGTDSSDTPMFAITNYDSYYGEMISLAIARYKSDTGYDGKVFCYADLVTGDSSTLHRLDFWIAPLDSSYFRYTFNSVTFHNDSGITRYYLYSSGGINNYFSAEHKGSVNSVLLSQNATNTNLVIYVSQDLSANLTDKETLYYKSPAPLYPVEEEPEEDNDFFFGAFEDFADFGEQSSEHYNNAMNQTVTENSNSPNDSVFQKLLQAMVGSLTTNNSITQQISNQLQHFTEQFFNNFAQYSLGLMNDILNTLNEFTGKFDSLLEITGQLYESGLDADGNFGVDTMLGYWFVPDPDTMHDMFSEAINSSSEFAEILDFAEWFKQHLVDLEPVAPMFTIQPGEYGFITIKNEIRISFEWFEVWKPYTDPLIAAFLYITYFWHLFMSIPGILNGTAATTYAATHMQEPNVPLVSNWQNGVFRK